MKINIDIGQTFLSVFSFFIILIISIPLVYLVVRVLGSDGNLLELIFRRRIYEIIIRTLTLVFSVTILSLIIALTLSWIIERTDIPWKKFFTILSVLPIVFPSYVAGMIFVDFLGPKGRVQGWLEPFGVTQLPEIYGFWGSTILLSLLSYPYLFLIIRSSLSRIDANLEEASKILGKNSLKTFFLVTLPLLRPAISSGCILVALYTLSDFGAVSLLRYETFTWAIMTQYESSFNRVVAASFSLVLIFFALLILILDGVIVKPKNYYVSGISGTSRKIKLIKLNLLNKIFSVFIIVLVIFFSVFFPFYGLTYWLIRGAIAGEIINFNWILVWNSISVSFLAAISCVFCSLLISLLIVKYNNKIGILTEKISYLGFGLPGIAIALGVIFVGLKLISPLYQTIALLILGYIILFLPVTIGAIKSSMLHINPHIEEASRSLGFKMWYTTLKITIPIIISGVLAGGILVFMLTMKELPATMILAPLGFETLSTSIWSYSSEAFFAKSAFPSMLLVLISGPFTAYLAFRGYTISDKPVKENLDV